MIKTLLALLLLIPSVSWSKGHYTNENLEILNTMH